jgi:hypothetical protein
MKLAFLKNVGRFLLFWESLKGNTTVHRIEHPDNALGYLEGYAIGGYTVQIFCQRKHYRRSYDKSFIPDQNLMTYHVFCKITDDAPEILKKVCNLDVDIPSLLPAMVAESDHRQAAINAYLDMLLVLLNNEVFGTSKLADALKGIAIKRY